MNKGVARAAAAALLLCAAAAPAPAAPGTASEPAAAEIGWLLGRWHGPGTFLGRSSEARLELKPALGGAFVELVYSVAAAKAPAPAAFEGRAFYRQEAGVWRARWFDSRGVSFEVNARLTGRELVAEWGSPRSERGRTVYRLAEDGGLVVIDSVAGADGRWREFARHRLAAQK